MQNQQYALNKRVINLVSMEVPINTLLIVYQQDDDTNWWLCKFADDALNKDIASKQPCYKNGWHSRTCDLILLDNSNLSENHEFLLI